MKKRKRFRKLKITGIVIAVIVLVVLVVDHSLASASYSKGGKQMKQIQNSPQYKDGKFRNAVAWKQPSFREYSSTMWEFLFGGDRRTPGQPLPLRSVDLAHFNAKGDDQLNVSWLGHSSLMINIDGYKILADPVFQGRISVFGPSRFNGDVPLDIERLPEIDVVIISHNHYDHLNKFSIRALESRTRWFFVPLGVGAELEGWGVPRGKIIQRDWWQESKVAEDLMIAATPSQHFSGRSLSDRDKTLWASWVIQGPHHKVFFSGDSGYFDGFKKIGETYGPFDMTFVECGAYNEKWHHIHMFPEETVQAHLDLKGKVLHPIHWATFNLSLHPWYEPMRRLSAAAASAGVVTATPIVGETTVYNSYIPSVKWWEPLVERKDTRLAKNKNQLELN